MERRHQRLREVRRVALGSGAADATFRRGVAGGGECQRGNLGL